MNQIKSSSAAPALSHETENTNELINLPFTEEEILNHINSLKNNKTPGVDNI